MRHWHGRLRGIIAINTGSLGGGRNAEHYLYARSEVEYSAKNGAFSAAKEATKMGILTDGYAFVKEAVNALGYTSFGVYESDFRGSPVTWDEIKSGHYGADYGYDVGVNGCKIS